MKRKRPIPKSLVARRIGSHDLCLCAEVRSNGFELRRSRHPRPPIAQQAAKAWRISLAQLLLRLPLIRWAKKKVGRWIDVIELAVALFAADAI
ncbi:hypothetical protein CEXT_33271 [Caerostris extrusa]|uniref:Uncharacterized protein n=1 Tax=Caerostris extrusa TaxID=172846 RepID=A0AAV4T6B6_CAEEX|nr:hypothetical protein CEXT_33271 [Caerostris extrusa]